MQYSSRMPCSERDARPRHHIAAPGWRSRQSGRSVTTIRVARVAIAAAGWYGGACATSGVAPTSPAPAPSPIPAFVIQPSTRPTISSGRAGWPILPVDPSIYVDDEGYHLFYSTFFCRREHGYEYSWDPADPTACDIENPITAIAYAFSGNRGLTWEFRPSPVVKPGDSGFDAARIETAAVFRLGDTLYVAYSADGERHGRRFTTRYQIGLGWLTLGRRSVRAVLMDASQQFQRRSQPLLPYDLRPGRFDNNVQEPSVVFGPDGIVLYYIGLGLRLPDESIDAAGQGIVSVGLGRAVLDEQLNVVSRSASAVLEGVNMPEVRYFDNAYHLFATTLGGGEAHRDEAISYATSADGVNWTTLRVILSPRGGGQFDDWGLMGPTAAVEPNRVVLFYTAFGTAPGACVPLGPEGRFGIPLPEGLRCLYATIGRAIGAPATHGRPRRDLSK